MSTGLTENMMDGISVVAEAIAGTVVSDKTIECEVVKVLNAAKGIYTVKYTDNKFTAHSTNNSDAYKIGDSVYVLVPQGDFIKNKLIIGLVEAKEKNTVKKKTPKYFNEVSENLLKSIDEIQLCTYHSEERSYNLKEFSTAVLAENYKDFVFSFDVRTDIKDIYQKNKGNYGVEISIPVKDTEGQSKILTEKIDTKNMNGNVYNFIDYITQNLTFNLEGYVFDLEGSNEITAKVFVENFIQNEEITLPDIFIKNISLKAIEQLTEKEMEGYYLDIKSEDGFQFLYGIYDKDKELKPSLMIDGAPADVKDFECFWFREDSYISEGVTGYNPQGGAGWRILNTGREAGISEDGNIIYDYDTFCYTCKVPSDDVISTARYKCILLNGNVRLEKIVTIYNLNHNITTSLKTLAKDMLFVKNIGDVVLDAELVYPNAPEGLIYDYRFERLDKNGNFIDSKFYERIKWDERDGDKHLTEIKFPVSIVDEFNTVKCEFVCQQLNNGVLETKSLGTEIITITVGENLYDYNLSIENEDILYKYDVNGNSPFIANFDGPVSSRMKESDILPLVAKIFKVNGYELSSSEYNQVKFTWKVSKDSLFIPKNYDGSDDEYYYIKNKTLSYKIANNFSKEKEERTKIFISAEFDNKSIPEKKVNIIFLKDGESGTNGSQYASLIYYQDEDGDYAYGELDGKGYSHKLRGIWHQNQWKKLVGENIVHISDPEFPKFKVKVWKNGAELSSNKYSVEWSMLEYNENVNTFNIGDKTGILTTVRGWNSTDDAPCNIVQAKIAIDSVEDDFWDKNRKREVIFAYYPIDTIYVVDNDVSKILVPEIAGGFDEVLYASDATNPQYNTDKPFEIKVLNSEINYKCNIDCSWENLEFKEDPNLSFNQSRIVPRNVYKTKTNGSQNYIKAYVEPNMKETVQLQSETINKIDKLEGEYSKLIKEKSFVSDLIDLFDYEDYIIALENNSTFLNYRSKYIFYLKQLKSLLSDMVDINSDYMIHINKINEIINNILSAESINDFDNFTTKFDSVESTNYKLNNLISLFNSEVEKSMQAYNLLINYNYTSEELENYNDFKTEIKNLNKEIDDCASTRQYTLEEKFINLKNVINGFSNYLSSNILSKDENLSVINQINNLFETYKDSAYIYESYTEELEKLSEDIEETYGVLGEELSEDDFKGAILLVKPIVMNVNKYSLSGINSWDGNKLYTGDNQEYLYAPQIGAGYKNNDGQFTGMVMGKRHVELDAGSKEETGLFGYKDGKQTIFLDAENGELTLGVPKVTEVGNGQIFLSPDPNKYNTIAGWIISEDKISKGFGWNTVSLLAPNYDDVPEAGRESQSAFCVQDFWGSKIVDIQYGGKLIAKNAEIEGKITAKEGGRIANWYIDGSGIRNSSNTIRINEGELVYGNGSFSVSSNGYLYCNNASISGTISSSTISGGSITGATISIGNGSFSVSSNGYLYCNNASISGTISGSSISGSSISGCTISTNSGNFSVDSNGNMSCSNANISGNITVTNGGKIGNWDIVDGALSQTVTYQSPYQRYPRYYTCYLKPIGSFLTELESEYIHTQYLRVDQDLSFEGDTVLTISRLRNSGFLNTSNVEANISNTGYSVFFRNTSGDSNGATIGYVKHKSTSDKRLKYNIKNLKDISDIYMNLRPVSFMYNNCVFDEDEKEEQKVRYGLIAQEVQKFDENLIIQSNTIPKTKMAEVCGKTYYRLQYQDLHAFHIQMIQKQQKEIEKLNQTIISLKGEIDIIKQQLRR